MLIQSIRLREATEAVRLDAYLLHNSAEFQTDQPRPVVIVCPGGGYLFTSDREAEPIAMRFLAQGYHAFVLRYSVNTLFPQPMLDLAKAIATVREHAAEWQIDPKRIAVATGGVGREHVVGVVSRVRRCAARRHRGDAERKARELEAKE